MKNNFNISELFFDAATKFPHRKAIIYRNSEIQFDDLANAVRSTAAYFIRKGIQKGDRVLVFVPMSIDLYRIVLALFSIGATAVFLDEWVNKKRMEECCKIAQCNGFIGIFKARVLSWFSSELRKIPIKLGVNSYFSFQPTHSKFPVSIEKDETALITFTTGSTGIPKAAKRTHHFLFKQFEALNDKLNPKEDDIDLPALPIVLFLNLGNGITSVIADFKASRPEKISPIKIVDQIKNNQVNRIIASPFFVKKIAQYLLQHNIQLPNITKIFTGGAPVFPSEAEIYLAAFPDATLEIVYGSTEAEPISSSSAKDLIAEKDFILKAGLNVGPVYKKAEVKIIKIIDSPIVANFETDLETLPNDMIGEIIVSGPHVLTEYFNNPEAIKRNKIFVNGKCWHRTGDSGYLADTGILYLTGRCSTIIYKDEKLIAPFLYENYLQSIAGVNIGTVLMIKKSIVCVLELNDSTIRLSVLNALNILPIKFDEVKFVKKIPRDLRHNSKIDYAQLVQKLQR